MLLLVTAAESGNECAVRVINCEAYRHHLSDYVEAGRQKPSRAVENLRFCQDTAKKKMFSKSVQKKEVADFGILVFISALWHFED